MISTVKTHFLGTTLTLTCLASPIMAQQTVAPTKPATTETKDTEEKVVAEIPKDLIEDPQVRAELGINEFTAPSIRLIFDDLDQLTPMPVKEPIAIELSKYGRALGAGDRVNRHAKALLESAKKKDLEALKDELSATQKDVEKELVQLKDADLAQLISLGGWIRALECAAGAVNREFTEERANQLFREDIAEYYETSLGGLEPRISEKESFIAIREICSNLKKTMSLGPDEEPSEASVKEITAQSKRLALLALTREK